MSERRKTIGTLLPLSALPSADYERAAADFLDWLTRTGQDAWQLLPLSETHLEPGSRVVRVPSPYKGYGVGFAERWLAPRFAALEPTEDELRLYAERHGRWIHDYALFAALCATLGTDDWTAWPAELRDRQPEALADWSALHLLDARRFMITQWRLHRQFTEMRAAAHKRGLSIIGDLPFYLPLQSPLVWANRACFVLDAAGRPSVVSGIPNKPTTYFGRQLWGHPLYRWHDADALPAVLELWRLRLESLGELFDVVRIDHAKGFYRYGSLNPQDESADAWRTGPGDVALDALAETAKRVGLRLFAEDDGGQIRRLRQALRRNGIPSIRILRFSLNDRDHELKPFHADLRRYRSDDYAYTTTHDTRTLLGYAKTLIEDDRRRLSDKLKVAWSDDLTVLAARWRDALIASPADNVIVPIQDWLVTEDRINVPGTELPVNDQNWRYALKISVAELPLFDARPR
jgi:4-alpha-glucanotransferase